MPVKKTVNTPRRTKESSPTQGTMQQKSCCSSPHKKNCFTKKILATLVGVLLAYLIFFVGTLIQNNLVKFHYIGQADKAERFITVEAEGSVSVRPDIAMTTMGMSAEKKTVEEAQKENTEVMNKLISRLKTLGIEEKDIQTDQYNVYPRYDYIDDGRELRGYEVSQQVNIKIRDLDKTSAVLALAGEVGATNVSGLSFTIDDTEAYVEQAREDALEKVKTKVESLESLLGVRRVGIMNYDEYEVSQNVYANRYKDMAMGIGTAEMAPAIEAGENEVKLNVRVTFEIR
ncbi:MAG: SIMPL domain-containing protein [Candidatus Magasanikbacteria bacterium]|jgi:uncharacterized protein|nr:SIMPL domain-containing protein [Candidatus Magasanikbacteria bacterium]MBT4071466.1 SIMPL domain-containing protein [Candidatus Magasanikbacteria bacterium]